MAKKNKKTNNQLSRLKLARMTEAQYQRLIKERKQLAEKIDKLQAFLIVAWNTMSANDYRLLEMQGDAMTTYLRILDFRLDREDDQERNRLMNGKKPRV